MRKILGRLHQDQLAAGAKQRLDVFQDNIETRGGVEDIGGDENIVAVGLKAVFLGCLLDVQGLVLDNAFKVREQLSCSWEEPW